MTHKNTGGPAFPLVELDRQTGNVCDQNFGMTLLDYFAGQALNGVIKNWGIYHRKASGGDGLGNEFTPENMELMAEDAYALADAMIKERNK